MSVQAVFDCMVFLQGAARAEGPAAACLRLAEAGHVELFLSVEVLDDVRDVLTRPRIRKKFPTLTYETVAAFLTRLGSFAHCLAETPSLITLARDPKDEKYLKLAVAARATHLVTWDQDLLSLMDNPGPDAQAIRGRLPHIAILDPVAFLRTLPLRQMP
ncbi:MAG: putative toxin-antitoxin system toxin component, PIN family [Planctomycetota bacterium]|nr:putative toxin-antitoxin system toxin component, PIN family [Planctomycetota bacterium]